MLSVRAQVEQARELRSELEKKPAPSAVSPERLFLQAAKHFEKIAQQVGGGKDGRDLLAFSQYNQAQALAKTPPIQKGDPVKNL